MNYLGIFKAATEFVVSLGAGAVVSNAVKMTTPADVKTLQKFSMSIGGFVLSSMVGDMASKYATKTIDDTIEELNKYRVQDPSTQTIYQEPTD